MRSFCFVYILQRGHIYTSSGSFFIEPVEVYTVDNQNILHKISREKMPVDKIHFDKELNSGKILIDELHSEDSNTDDLSEDEIIAEDDDELELDEENDPSVDSDKHSDDLIENIIAMNRTKCTQADNKSKQYL